MRGFLGFVLVIGIVIGVVGFYRGWFSVNEERIKEDTKKAIERVEEVRDKAFPAKSE